MFIYRDGDAISSYLRRSAQERFCVDYWLFINAEHTHRLFRTRPLGMKSLARVVCEFASKDDKTLLCAMKQEVIAYLPVLDLVGIEYPDPRSLSPSTPWFNEDWRLFLSQMAVDAHGFVSGLVREYDRAMAEADISRLAFLSRRLSSELLDAGFSRAELREYMRGRLDSGDPLTLTKLVESRGENTKLYNVIYKFDPRDAAGVKFPQEISGKAWPVVESLQALSPTGEVYTTEMLVGMRCGVKARSYVEALDKGLKLAQIGLDHIRTAYYVRTGLVGPIHARIIDEDSERWFSLNRPFWGKHLNTVRKAPTLPKQISVLWKNGDDPHAERWRAARWHISYAIEVWGEDVHRASSHVWQAIECISPSRRDHVRDMIMPYLEIEKRRILDFLLHQHNGQRRYLRQFGYCDWPHVGPEAETTQKIWALMLDRNCPTNFRRWKNPAAPALLFHAETGLLHGLLGHEGRMKQPVWMARRLALDFDQLYGIRNAVVHRGRRLGTDQWAAYLAEVGLEVLFNLASVQISKVQDRIAAPRTGLDSLEG